jgi:hypothetical protein
MFVHNGNFFTKISSKKNRNSSKEIIAPSLCLIRVSFVILVVANLLYGFKLALNMLVKKTLVAFTCNQLVN